MLKNIFKKKKEEPFCLAMGKCGMVAVLMAGLMAIQGCGIASNGVGLNLETVTQTKAVLEQLEDQSFSYNADLPEPPQDPSLMQSRIQSSRLSMPNFSEGLQSISVEFNDENTTLYGVSCQAKQSFYSAVNDDDVVYTYSQKFHNDECSDPYETEKYSGESGNIFYEKRRENEVISKFSQTPTDSGTNVNFIDKETYPYMEMEYKESDTNESYDSLTVTYENGAQFISGSVNNLELSVMFTETQASLKAFQFKLNLDDSKGEAREFTGNFKFATDENTLIDHEKTISFESLKYYMSDLYDEESLKVARILIDENKIIHIAYYDTDGNLGEYSPEL